MKKSILLAGVACVLIATNASAGMREMIDHTKYYVGADYAFSKFDYKGDLDRAKDSYSSGILNVGARMDRIGIELFGQMTGSRTQDLEDSKLKTKVYAYGMDVYGYQPLGCEGKYDLLASIGLANYHYKGESAENDKSANRIGYRFGLGAMYNFNDNISARLMARYAYIGADTMNHAAELTAGMRYNF